MISCNLIRARPDRFTQVSAKDHSVPVAVVFTISQRACRFIEIHSMAAGTNKSLLRAVFLQACQHSVMLDYPSSYESSEILGWSDVSPGRLV
jgi:hypothetical protein